jgi:hypothetical protein
VKDVGTYLVKTEYRSFTDPLRDVLSEFDVPEPEVFDDELPKISDRPRKRGISEPEPLRASPAFKRRSGLVASSGKSGSKGLISTRNKAAPKGAPSKPDLMDFLKKQMVVRRTELEKGVLDKSSSSDDSDF